MNPDNHWFESNDMKNERKRTAVLFHVKQPIPSYEVCSRWLCYVNSPQQRGCAPKGCDVMPNQSIGYDDRTKISLLQSCGEVSLGKVHRKVDLIKISHPLEGVPSDHEGV